jgi:alkylation response protein AidB-like acyl-CoA dehydrogenase
MTSVYSDHEASLEWQRILLRKGWAAPAWPVEYGGLQLDGRAALSFCVRIRALGRTAPVSDGHQDGVLPRSLHSARRTRRAINLRAC